MKESKKSTVSMLEEQQSWGPKTFYLGDDRKLHCKASWSLNLGFISMNHHSETHEWICGRY